MNAPLLRSRMLSIAGFIAMLIGAIDPLEGSPVILLGSGLVALAAFLDRSRHRLILYSAFGLITIGVATMFGLSMLGGVGGSTGRSSWWLLTVLPFPIGWILGIVGVILKLRESFKTQVQ